MKVMIKILRGLLTAALCAIILMNLWMLVQQRVLKKDAPEVFGYSQYIVTTGSMEPEIPAGSIILVKAQEQYELGDVVTFRDSQGLTVTHRLMGRVSGQFITKGDANNVEDSELLAPENILGKVQMVVGGSSSKALGSMVTFLRSPFGLLVLLAAGVLLIKLPDWAGALKTKAKGKHAHEVER